MSTNKKILNATPTDYQNIHFKSTIEKTIYKTLIEYGITPLYEEVTYTLSPKITPSKVLYYTRRKIKGASKHELKLDISPIREITYTPDFTFTLNKIFVILEIKGFMNDVYPVKKNLFRKCLEKFVNVPTMFFEIRSKKELLKALDIITSTKL